MQVEVRARSSVLILQFNECNHKIRGFTVYRSLFTIHWSTTSYFSFLSLHDGTYRISRIFFKRNSERIGTIHHPLRHHSQQDTDHSLPCSTSNAVVMIGSTQQNQGMHCHLINVSQFRSSLHNILCLHRSHLVADFQ